MTDIDRTNQRSRAEASDAKSATYRHWVVVDWPGCTACGEPIMRNIDVGRPGLWRTCGCPGEVWFCHATGWEMTR